MMKDLFVDVTEVKETGKNTKCSYKQNKHANCPVV